MEQNIADLLKDAFSEVDIDFEHLHFDESNNAAQTQLAMDENIDLKDASKLWTCDQGSVEAVSNVYAEEKNEDTDGSEEDVLSYLPEPNTGSVFCPSQRMDYDHVVEMTTTKVNKACEESTVKDESMISDEETDVSMHGLVTDVDIFGEEKDLSQEEAVQLYSGSVEDQGTVSTGYQPESLGFTSQTQEDLVSSSSGSEEEEPENYSSKEQPSQFDSEGNIDEPFIAIKPNMPAGLLDENDLREFTEEDQDQIEESLAEYPSDFSQSEPEDCAESSGDQMLSHIDNNVSNDDSTNKKDLDCVEENNLLEDGRPLESTATESATEITDMDDQKRPETPDIDVPFQSENADENEESEDDLQEPLTDDIRRQEDAMIMDQGIGGEEASNWNDQPEYDNDISSDDSTSEEETTFPSSIQHEGESKSDIQHSENLQRVNQDTDRIRIDREGRKTEIDRYFPDESSHMSNISYRKYCYEEPSEESMDMYPSSESVYTNLTITEQDQVLDTVKNINTLIPETLWSSEILAEGGLFLDDYDWSLSEEDLLKMNLGEDENQDDKEEPLEDLDSDDGEDGEQATRDWEQEKPRIEAFYKFYGDQVETEDKMDRNHKVTFSLDPESSEEEEDSDSSEEDLDKEPITPVTTLKPEYHSDSDEALEKPFHYEKPKLKQKEQQHVSPAQNGSPQRNKCLAVLKSVLALGLVTVIGVASFWWATDNLDWIH